MAAAACAGGAASASRHDAAWNRRLPRRAAAMAACGLSGLSASLCCVVMAATYVGSLYLLPRRLTKLHRDHPAHVRGRFVAVTVACVAPRRSLDEVRVGRSIRRALARARDSTRLIKNGCATHQRVRAHHRSASNPSRRRDGPSKTDAGSGTPADVGRPRARTRSTRRRRFGADEALDARNARASKNARRDADSTSDGSRESDRLRKTRDMDRPWTGRGDAAATTWIFRRRAAGFAQVRRRRRALRGRRDPDLRRRAHRRGGVGHRTRRVVRGGGLRVRPHVGRLPRSAGRIRFKLRRRRGRAAGKPF